MLVMIALTVVVQAMSMAMQVLFYAVAGYWVAKMVHKGWKAGK